MQNNVNDIVTAKERQILDSQREIDWLKRQIAHYEQILSSAPPSSSEPAPPPSSDSQENDNAPSKDSLDTLRAQLDVLCQFNMSKECLTRSLDASHYVLKALYPPISDHASMARNEQLKQLIEERDNLVVSFMQTFKECRHIKNELAKTQAQIIQRHQDNRKLMTAIQEAKMRQLEDELAEGNIAMPDGMNTEGTNPEEVLRELQAKWEIARNVLIRLIIESGIDWANDEHWLKVMLRIGDELS